MQKRVVKSIQLQTPSNEAVCEALRSAFKENFEEFSVSWVDCPDLRKWGLCAKGLCGNIEIADIGSPLNVEKKDLRHPIYAFEEIAEICNRKGECLMFGAGAASSRVVKVNAELMPNINLETKENGTFYTLVDDQNQYRSGRYNSSEFGGLCNVGICDGDEGLVIEVKCRKRKGKKNFVDVLADGLLLSSEEQVSGCGVFKLVEGKVKAHVMPDFPSCDLNTSEEVNSIIHVGSFFYYFL